MKDLTDMTSEERKQRPLYTGVLLYFPDALAEVAHTSYVGNEQHNLGQHLHWAKHKSTDHGNCILRHQMDAGTMDTDGMRHSAKVAWRALAQLQIEIEAERAGLPVDLYLRGLQTKVAADRVVASCNDPSKPNLIGLNRGRCRLCRGTPEPSSVDRQVDRYVRVRGGTPPLVKMYFTDGSFSWWPEADVPEGEIFYTEAPDGQTAPR